MHNLFKALKNTFKSPLEKIFEEEQIFLHENAPKAIEHLKSLGYNILSTDKRIAFYSFKIQKHNNIHSISVREALEMS